MVRTDMCGYDISMFYITIDMLPKYFNQFTICYYLTGENTPKDNVADAGNVCTVMPVMFYTLMHLNVCYARKYNNPPPRT